MQICERSGEDERILQTKPKATEILAFDNIG